MIWIIYNIGILAMSVLPTINPMNVLNGSLFYILNALFLAVWLFLPRMVIALIKFKMKIGSN
jgi:hypothetical protein